MYKVLVTGGCGFIGSNFILRLRKKKDWDILNIDKLTYSGNLDNLDSIKSNYTFLQGDICDNQLIKKSIDDFQPNYIVNFAAESHVDRSIDSYSDFINTNILGTINLLDCSLKYFNSNSDTRSIITAIKKLYSKKFQSSLKKTKNIYQKKNTCFKINNIILNYLK